ncbi:tRNA sulfurtransferase, partial [Haemophilus influenzae]
AQKCG